MARFVRVILLLIVIAGVPLTSTAQTGLNEIARAVKVLDKNFDIADKNHDGLLTKQEAENGPVSFIARNFDAIDTKHRGVVSKEDVHAYIATTLMRSSQPASATSAGAAHP
ncbi:EF-hand domain-containing protein [Dyella caseinilytica]|uniref:EF-hand domain-containing protein n=1 Tax=Dyella caseinilytica TaxID=1849581 RepID=A0ABX7GRG0_9GAMM|nr:EF-hand domain-containing protein [Dyella caseinilytica]QRN53003.1 EF-hand domain-containing protein [Dyella caseinilytica]GGA10696.1 hypothetical protein GCM10011408_35010 [Dyella caseinilytica]